MEPQRSLVCSQELTTGPEPDESNPLHTLVFSLLSKNESRLIKSPVFGVCLCVPY
jgi:hypothetical protein